MPRVLVVEDTPINQLVVRRILERAGCEVETAVDGQAAVQAYAAATYELILMDVQMPELDGFEATRQIRAQEATTGRHTPIVAMTASAIQGDRARGIEVGMDDFLTKPIRPADVDAVLQRWVSRATGDSPVLEGPVEDWLASVYLEEEAGALGALRAAVAANDPAQVTFAAHTLKGSAGAIGAVTLTALCARLEALGRAGTLDEAAVVLAEIDAAAAAVHGALAATA